jgi:lipopolysaccharide transport system ATP-binding protein
VTALLRVEALGKRFRLYPRPLHRAVEWASLGRLRFHEEIWAVRDVTLSVAAGEVVGVIGLNGAGKTTLLRLVAGSLDATEGIVDVRGRMACVLAIGSGLNEELTGRENVLLLGDLLGYHDEVRRHLDAIASFAELGAFFDRPVSLYSVGMKMRLGFALHASLESDLLVLDEALSAGDVLFGEKCHRRMEALMDRGTAMLMVTHDFGEVRRYCRRVLVLHRGRIVHEAGPEDAIAHLRSLGAAPPPG